MRDGVMLLASISSVVLVAPAITHALGLPLEETESTQEHLSLSDRPQKKACQAKMATINRQRIICKTLEASKPSV